jgi:hypothetical protein
VNQIPGEVADVRAGELRRGITAGARVAGVEERFGRLQGIGGAGAGDRGGPAIGGEDVVVARAVTEDGKSPPALPAHDAFQKEARPVGGGLTERRVCAHRREVVGDERARCDHAPIVAAVGPLRQRCG